MTKKQSFYCSCQGVQSYEPWCKGCHWRPCSYQLARISL